MTRSPIRISCAPRTYPGARGAIPAALAPASGRPEPGDGGRAACPSPRSQGDARRSGRHRFTHSSRNSTAFSDRSPEADAAYAAERLRSAGVSTPVRIKLGHPNGIAAVEARPLREQWEKDGLFRVELVEKRDLTTYQKRSLPRFTDRSKAVQRFRAAQDTIAKTLP